MWKYRKVSELEKLAIWKGHFASLSTKKILEITENKTSNVRYFGNENRKLTSAKIFQINQPIRSSIFDPSSSTVQGSLDFYFQKKNQKTLDFDWSLWNSKDQIQL